MLLCAYLVRWLFMDLRNFCVCEISCTRYHTLYMCSIRHVESTTYTMYYTYYIHVHTHLCTCLWCSSLYVYRFGRLLKVEQQQMIQLYCQDSFCSPLRYGIMLWCSLSIHIVHMQQLMKHTFMTTLYTITIALRISNKGTQN